MQQRRTDLNPKENLLSAHGAHPTCAIIALLRVPSPLPLVTEVLREQLDTSGRLGPCLVPCGQSGAVGLWVPVLSGAGPTNGSSRAELSR